MGVTCEQCWADDMAVNEQGYYQCDQCGYILHSVVPESAELDDTPGGAGMQGRRHIGLTTTVASRHLEIE
jgi:tRNA(Ile2) C34 agmatinyltransferase TiaS